MRALIWITVIAAVLWGGYWFAASTAVERGVEGWFADQVASGMVAERSGLRVAGFPSRVDVTVDGLHLANPETGTGWRAPQVQVFSMTWKPWHVIAAFPSGQVVDLPGQSVTVDGTDMGASLELHPGTALALNRIRADGKAVKLTSTAGWSLSAAKLTAATEDDPSLANTHRIGLTVEEIAPDPAFVQALADPALPAVIPRLHLDAHVTLTAPIDRFAGESQPHVTGLDISDLSLDWGPVAVRGKGKLMPNADGVAEGEIALTITDWRRAMKAIVAMGSLTQDQADVLSKGLQTLADAGADPNVLSLPLRAANGRLSLGPLPLGAAPRLN
jgi:hypothetical protein